MSGYATFLWPRCLADRVDRFVHRLSRVKARCQRLLVNEPCLSPPTLVALILQDGKPSARMSTIASMTTPSSSSSGFRVRQTLELPCRSVRPPRMGCLWGSIRGACAAATRGVRSCTARRKARSFMAARMSRTVFSESRTVFVRHDCDTGTESGFMEFVLRGASPPRSPGRRLRPDSEANPDRCQYERQWRYGGSRPNDHRLERSTDSVPKRVWPNDHPDIPGG
jgi:hypothetical protein